MSKNIFIGVAWPYVNGDLHIGHLAGYLLPADICARYNRLIGNNVLMASGSDCFGTPITVEADKKGVSPEQLVNEYHPKNVELFTKTLGLTFDIYTLTNTPNHIAVVQDFFLKLLEKEYIYVNTTEQYYSEAEKRFLPDRYVVGTCPYCQAADSRSDQCDQCGKLIEEGKLLDPKSNISHQPVERRSTEHYFLDWKKMQGQLEAYVHEHGSQWRPWVLAETIGWLQEGLTSRAITRDIDWGVPLPIEAIPEAKRIKNIESKRLYVWFDAVIGYFSASKLWAKEQGRDWGQFWHGNNLKHYYFMGKDNLVFHTLFWPGKLMNYDASLHLPDVPCVNMFLNLDGSKFSKSRGVMLKIDDIVRRFGNDPVRFFIATIMPEHKDSSFSWASFQETINNVLVGTIGNFIHRTLSVGYRAGKLSDTPVALSAEVLAIIPATFQAAGDCLEHCEFREYTKAVVDLATFGNKMCQDEKIWELAKENPQKLAVILAQLYAVILAIGYLIDPLMPESAEKIFALFGMTKPTRWPEPKDALSEIGGLVSNLSIPTEPKPLFSKILKIEELEEEAAAK